MPGNDPFQIIYQDESIIVINKPSGLLTIPDGYHPEIPCLKNLLSHQFGKVFTVHRLDKDTSGILIFARTQEAHKILSYQFESRIIKKEYRAIAVSSSIAWEEITCTLPLRVNGDRNHRTIVDQMNGKSAGTIFRLMQSSNEYHYLFTWLLNGYTHQIRSHAAALAIPLLSDPLYHHISVPREVQLRFDIIPRVALHAFSISFEHPTLMEIMTFSAEIPSDFHNALQGLSLI
ncbi:MAG: RluA family pseudouridine synthase [Anaerolineaceae bacterium]